MRKIAAAAVAIPFIVYLYVSSLIRRSLPGRRLAAGPVQLVAVAVAVVLLVGGLLLGLPAKEVAGVAPPSFAPLVPQAEPQKAGTTLPIDVAFEVQFTKPMNEATVQDALSIYPPANVKFLWDATGQVVSLAPDPFWQPNTGYTVQISGAATDQEGLGLATPIQTSFESGAPTSGQLVATQTVGKEASPATAFQLTFTQPVKLATVMARLVIQPPAAVGIVGDDPTDVASQVFTITPNAQLASNTDYTIGLADGGTDSAGAALQPVPVLHIHTMLAPTVVRFRPVAGGVTYDTNQPVSVRFTMAMDEKSTAAAFSVTVNGRAVSGSKYWAEGDTVLVLTPRYAFKVGSKVVARVSTAARAAGAGGMHLVAAASATFTVSKPRSTSIAFGGGGGVHPVSALWYSSEVYYLRLMNCTRTGGWVTPSGACSSVTHHTLPAQGPVSLNANISNRVSRPYAKYMADNRVLNHFLRGTTPHSRLCAAGYCGASWGENIASPTSSGRAGMIKIETFFQNEYWKRCPNHYCNIMDPYFHRVGIGVWVSKGAVRVSIDFYG